MVVLLLGLSENRLAIIINVSNPPETKHPCIQGESYKSLWIFFFYRMSLIYFTLHALHPCPYK